MWLPTLSATLALLAVQVPAPPVPVSAPAPRAPSTPSGERARAAFTRLQELVGEWEGTTEAGRRLLVQYRLVAKGSVLVESWTLGPGRESLTLYHLDGDRLLATHYCPLGNQPRLALDTTASADPGLLVFTYVSATNLPDPAAAHQHRFEVRLSGPDRFWRNETYIEGTSEGSEAITYTRVRPRS
jgi:hypothetical protein